MQRYRIHTGKPMPVKRNGWIMTESRDAADEKRVNVAVDAETGATDWAHAFAAQDKGGKPAPPAPLPPGFASGLSASCGGCGRDIDASTGATPGVASACRDLGLQSVEGVVRERGIKPPGIA